MSIVIGYEPAICRAARADLKSVMSEPAGRMTTGQPAYSKAEAGTGTRITSVVGEVQFANIYLFMFRSIRLVSLGHIFCSKTSGNKN